MRERPRPWHRATAGKAWRPFPRRALPHRAFPATVAPCHLPHSRCAPCHVRGAHLRDALPAAFELQSSSSTVATVEPLTWRDRRVLVSHTRARSAFPLRGGDPSGACIVRIRCELTERGRPLCAGARYGAHVFYACTQSDSHLPLAQPRQAR